MILPGADIRGAIGTQATAQTYASSLSAIYIHRYIMETLIHTRKKKTLRAYIPKQTQSAIRRVRTWGKGVVPDILLEQERLVLLYDILVRLDRGNLHVLLAPLLMWHLETTGK